MAICGWSEGSARFERIAAATKARMAEATVHKTIMTKMRGR
jgi:hypothetical protein